MPRGAARSLLLSSDTVLPRPLLALLLLCVIVSRTAAPLPPHSPQDAATHRKHTDQDRSEDRKEGGERGEELGGGG